MFLMSGVLNATRKGGILLVNRIKIIGKMFVFYLLFNFLFGVREYLFKIPPSGWYFKVD